MTMAKFVTEVPLPAERMSVLKPLMVLLVSWMGTQGTAKVDWVAEWLPWVTGGGLERWSVGEKKGRTVEEDSLAEGRVDDLLWRL
jgi:hypothetical protein